MEIDKYKFDNNYCVINCNECERIMLINIEKLIEEYEEYKKKLDW